MKILKNITLILSIVCIHSACHATFFEIENLRIGPNPLVQGKDPLMINYVASIPHSAEYLVYTITGELLLKINFDNNIPGITHAGECQFTLINSLTMNRLPKQLYVVIASYNSGSKKIKKKKYVIVK